MLYKRVYFRLDDNGYNGSGWTDETFAKRFEDEIVGLFQSDGWEWINSGERARSGICPKVKKGMQELYLHPQATSGIVLADNIPHVESLLGTARAFRHYRTNIYEDYVLMSDEEYLRRLGDQREAIVRDVLERFCTKRRNLYITGFNLLDSINEKYRIKRVGKQSQYCDLEASFISNIFNELLTKGLIVTADTRNGTGYRTAKAGGIPKEDKSA